ncbi:MAG: response regulator [Betaproteobacteria bacterium]|nr:response regulator [Betaproteobacteria bacterium]
MRSPARILVADDNPDNRDIFRARLAAHGYEILTARDGAEALVIAHAAQPDLLLLDVMMPNLDGIEVCRRLKGDAALSFMPIIMVTARTGSQDVITGLDAGADEYLTKPVDQAALVARVRSMLRIKLLQDRVRAQAGQLEAQATQLAQWNHDLEARVAEQVQQLTRLSRLRRFVAPQLADLIVSGDAADPLVSHRREVTVVFLDLRGFTTFAETAEPEEVMGVLRDYHAAMGRLVQAHEGTLERFTGDGLMIFFNDPVEVANPAERAVRMALDMRDAVTALRSHWRRRGIELGLGIGIAEGYATIGAIGFGERMDYGAIGTVTNLAARLCAEAQSGQILVSSRVLGDIGELVDAEPVGDLALKGFARALPAFAITGLSRNRP